jgi:hypothetical protein
MVIPTPLLVHRPGQLLGKKLVVIELYPIPHDVIGRPRQFIGQGAMGDHPL